MATSVEIAAYRSELGKLTDRALSDLASALRALEGQPPVVVRNALIAAFPDLLGPYIEASAQMSAVWYENLRRKALSTPYYATTSGPVNQSRVESLVRFGVKPLFGQSDSTVLSLMGGGLQRLIADASRDTIDINARRDPATVSWARQIHPERAKSGKSCDFCVMLAGRGSVYRSSRAAGVVIGSGVDPSEAFGADGARKVGGIGGGIHARGVRELASRFHDDCHCTVAPTFYAIESIGGSRFLVPIKD